MRIRNLIIIVSTSLIATRSLAQNDQNQYKKYRHFAIYAGVGPSYFFNNLTVFKNDVNSLGYEFTFRFMWEPKGSFLSLGFETGYYRIYTVSATQPVNAKVTNSEVPLQFVVSMKFSKQLYANWSMGQSIQYNKVSAPDNPNNFNNHLTSLADFTATVGYRFIQKERISYAAEFKGYYSSAYANGTIALVFIVGFRL
jgi:putative flippase GtrA